LSLGVTLDANGGNELTFGNQDGRGAAGLCNHSGSEIPHPQAATQTQLDKAHQAQ
jgi:hypothetical protein